jgi:protease-4
VLVFLWLAISLISPVLGWLLRSITSDGSGETVGSSTLEEVVIEDNGSRHKIAVIEVEGLITGGLIDGLGRNMVSLIEDQLQSAAEDAAVKAVLLKVDSPGGEILAADEIHRAIQSFQTTAKKPVLAYLGGVAASGGYYVSAPSQWIIAHELTITGSIGVIMHLYNYRGLLDKVGVRPVVYKSGRFKDMLSGEKTEAEVTTEEGDMVRGLIQQSYEKFKRIIVEGRQWAREKNQGQGRALAANWETYADGRIFPGQEAYQYGFVDELGDFKQAVKRTRLLARIEQANLVRYQPPFNFGALLRWLVKSDAGAIKVEWGLDLPKLRWGRLYFLSPNLPPF